MTQARLIIALSLTVALLLISDGGCGENDGQNINRMVYPNIAGTWDFSFSGYIIQYGTGTGSSPPMMIDNYQLTGVVITQYLDNITLTYGCGYNAPSTLKGDNLEIEGMYLWGVSLKMMGTAKSDAMSGNWTQSYTFPGGQGTWRAIKQDP
jgi:hypothetical protein